VISFGSADVPAENLPPSQPAGAIYLIVPADEALSVPMLEVPFESGRGAVRQALELNWASGAATPLEFRLLNEWIWGSAAPATGTLPPASAQPSPTAYTAALLDHPVFVTWFWQTPEVEAAGRALGQKYSVAARTNQIITLAQTEFGPEQQASYRRRLQRMAEWLTIAGQSEAAALAQAAAEEVATVAPTESPFVCRLIGTGLDLAVLSARGKPQLKRV
jgi:hypothetical protein